MPRVHFKPPPEITNGTASPAEVAAWNKMVNEVNATTDNGDRMNGVAKAAATAGIIHEAGQGAATPQDPGTGGTDGTSGTDTSGDSGGGIDWGKIIAGAGSAIKGATPDVLAIAGALAEAQRRAQSDKYADQALNGLPGAPGSGAIAEWNAGAQLRDAGRAGMLNPSANTPDLSALRTLATSGSGNPFAKALPMAPPRPPLGALPMAPGSSVPGALPMAPQILGQSATEAQAEQAFANVQALINSGHASLPQIVAAAKQALATPQVLGQNVTEAQAEQAFQNVQQVLRSGNASLSQMVQAARSAVPSNSAGASPVAAPTGPAPTPHTAAPSAPTYTVSPSSSPGLALPPAPPAPPVPTGSPSATPSAPLAAGTALPMAPAPASNNWLGTLATDPNAVRDVATGLQSGKTFAGATAAPLPVAPNIAVAPGSAPLPGQPALPPGAANGLPPALPPAPPTTVGAPPSSLHGQPVAPRALPPAPPITPQVGNRLILPMAGAA